MLTRLWILEETTLSNTIQFVNGRSLDQSIANQSSSTSAASSETAIQLTSTRIQLTSTRFALKLQELAKAWAGAYLPWQSTPKSAVAADSTAFIRGYFENATIRRSGVNVRPLHPFPEIHTFYSHIFSTRRTSKPRDFILATMPQYSFYRVPAKRMSFAPRIVCINCGKQGCNRLFRDSLEVSRSRNWLLRNTSSGARMRILRFQKEGLLKFPLPEINAQDEESAPEPACLGDLVKLFCGPRILWEFYPSLDADDSDLEKYTALPATEIIANPFSTILPAKKVDYPENWRIISPFLDTLVSIAQTRKVDSVSNSGAISATCTSRPLFPKSRL